AVRHRHHHLAFDDGQGLQLVFEVPAPLLVGGAQRALLSVDQADRANDRDGGREDQFAGGIAHARMIHALGGGTGRRGWKGRRGWGGGGGGGGGGGEGGVEGGGGGGGAGGAGGGGGRASLPLPPFLP